MLIIQWYDLKREKFVLHISNSCQEVYLLLLSLRESPQKSLVWFMFSEYKLSKLTSAYRFSVLLSSKVG
jgi:hypothetical protein